MLKGPGFGLNRSGKELASIRQIMFGNLTKDLSRTGKITLGINFYFCCNAYLKIVCMLNGSGFRLIRSGKELTFIRQVTLGN